MIIFYSLSREPKLAKDGYVEYKRMGAPKEPGQWPEVETLQLPVRHIVLDGQGEAIAVHPELEQLLAALTQELTARYEQLAKRERFLQKLVNYAGSKEQAYHAMPLWMRVWRAIRNV